MNKTDVLKQYRNHMGGRSPQDLRLAERFLEYAEALDRENVDAFMNQLKRQKYKPGSLNHFFGVLRTLFKVLKVEWPYRKFEAPRVTRRDQHKPKLSLRVVTQMIEAARAGKLLPECVPFLAIASTYGFRRGEMTTVGPEDVRDGLIYRHTEKGGNPRWHQVPPEIQDIIVQHDWSQRYSLGRMSQMFWDVVNGTGGLDALKSIRLGWHSIRRPLLELLQQNGCGVLEAKYFLCWGSGEGEVDAMPLRYFGNTEIDVDGEVVVSKEAESDSVIFEKYHPYLKLWRE